MKSQKIKAVLIEREGSITAAAQTIGESPDRLSETIHYHRVNRRIREKLYRKFRIRFDEGRNVRVNELRKAA